MLCCMLCCLFHSFIAIPASNFYVHSNIITCRTTITFTTAGEGRVLLHNFPGSTPPSPAMQVLQHKVGSATLINQNSRTAVKSIHNHTVHGRFATAFLSAVLPPP